jgi:hypothetical protein
MPRALHGANAAGNGTMPHSLHMYWQDMLDTQGQLVSAPSYNAYMPPGESLKCRETEALTEKTAKTKLRASVKG